MNRWKIAFFVAILVAVISNGYWFVRLVDSAISYSYLSDSYDSETIRFMALGELIVAGSSEYSQAEVLHLLRLAQPDAFIVEEDDKLFFKGIEFAFIDDRLVKVR